MTREPSRFFPPSCPRKRASRANDEVPGPWIPAFAGMTEGGRGSSCASSAYPSCSPPRWRCSMPAAAQAACDPAAGLTFVCGLTNAEDLVPLPGTPWIIASGLADAEHAEWPPLSRECARTARSRCCSPAMSSIGRTARHSAPARARPTRAKFSAHGLSLRVGAASEDTLYVVHHGERESVEVFTLKAGIGGTEPDLGGLRPLSRRRC